MIYSYDRTINMIYYQYSSTRPIIILVRVQIGNKLEQSLISIRDCFPSLKLRARKFRTKACGQESFARKRTPASVHKTSRREDSPVDAAAGGHDVLPTRFAAAASLPNRANRNETKSIGSANSAYDLVLAHGSAHRQACTSYQGGKTHQRALVVTWCILPSTSTSAIGNCK